MFLLKTVVSVFSCKFILLSRESDQCTLMSSLRSCRSSVYNRGGQPVAHAPYVAHWLLKSGALQLSDDKLLLLTNFFLFALHRYFSVENRTSEGVKTFFVFCSPPTSSVKNRTSEGIGARVGATVPCPPPFGHVIRC